MFFFLFLLIVGARVYRETPSTDDTQQCIWEALTTGLQELKDLIADSVEIDPDRSEEERLLYKRISEELIPDIEIRERVCFFKISFLKLKMYFVVFIFFFFF